MSDYNPTYTVQWRDYAWAREERRRTGNLFVKAPIITEVRPNPLSMELRIVLVYFWELYRKVEQRIAAFQAAGVAVRPDLKVERQDCLDTARNLCHDLFEVTSCFHPYHIHSEYGCNDETCPAWERGYETAKENVLDWYTPDC